jgi:hypothetical protein
MQELGITKAESRTLIDAAHHAKGRLCRMRVGAPAALAYARAAPEHTCRLPASHMVCSRMLGRVRCFPS